MKHLILLLSFFTALISCKKSETEPATPAVASNTGNSPSSGLTPSVGGDWCNLQTSYVFTETNGVVTKDSMVFASFYTAPVSSVVPVSIPAGTVSLNGQVLPYNTAFNHYSAALPNTIPIRQALNWQVTGSGTITAFTQTFVPSYAVYAGASSLPDTIHKSNGVVISITGVSNYQGLVTAVIRTLSGASTPFKYSLNPNGTVSFSAGDLAALTSGQPVQLSLTFSNLYSANHGGILRGFSNAVIYTKYCYLKP